MTYCNRITVDKDLIENAKTLLNTNEESIIKKAELFALLGNEVRLKIVKLFLTYERMCVCDLVDVLNMKQSPISQHLRKLKDGKVLINKREGMTVFYSISPDMKEQLENIIQ